MYGLFFVLYSIVWYSIMMMYNLVLYNILSSQFPNMRVMPASEAFFLGQVLGDLGLSDLSPSSSLSSLGLSSLLALRISTKCARRGAQISIRGLLAPNATVSTAAQSKGPKCTKVVPTLLMTMF